MAPISIFDSAITNANRGVAWLAKTTNPHEFDTGVAWVDALDSGRRASEQVDTGFIVSGATAFVSDMSLWTDGVLSLRLDGRVDGLDSVAGPQLTDDAESNLGLAIRLIYSDTRNSNHGLVAKWRLDLLVASDSSEPYQFSGTSVDSAGDANTSSLRNAVRDATSVQSILVDRSSTDINWDNLTWGEEEVEVEVVSRSLFDNSVFLNSTPGVVWLHTVTDPQDTGSGDTRLIDSNNSSRRASEAIDAAYIVGGVGYVTDLHFFDSGNVQLRFATTVNDSDGGNEAGPQLTSSGLNIGIALRLNNGDIFKFPITDITTGDSTEPFRDPVPGVDVTFNKALINNAPIQCIFVDRTNPSIDWDNLTYLIPTISIEGGNLTFGATSLSASSNPARFIDPTDLEISGGNIEFANVTLTSTGTVFLDLPTILSGGNIEFSNTSLSLTGTIRLDSQLVLPHFVIKRATFSRVALVEAEIDNSGWMYQMENDNDQGELLDGTLGLTDDFVITNIRRFSGAFQINDRILPRAISTYFAGVGLDLTVTIQDKDGFASFPVDGTLTSALAAGWIRWVAPQPFLDIISRIATGDRFLLGFTRGGDISLNGGVFTFGETSLSASVDPVTLLPPLRIDIAGGNFTSGATSLSAIGDIQLVNPLDIEISGGSFISGASSLSVVGNVQLVDPTDIEIPGGNIEFEDPTLQWMGVVGFKIDIHPPLALGGGEILFSNHALTWLGAIEFEDTILKLKGGEVLFSNHSLTWLGAIEFEDTILILGGGEILFSGTSLELVGDIVLRVVPNLILSGGEILFTNTSFVSFGTVDVSDPGARVPQRPLGFMVSAGSMEIDLSWFGSGVNDSNENAVTAWYFRYRQYSNDGTPSLWTEWTTIPGSRNNTTSYKITNLQNESIYGLQIFAENASGLGIPSVERQVTPSTIPDLRELEYQVLIDIMGDGSFLDSNGRIFDVWPDRIKENTTVRRGRTFRGSQISQAVAGETSFRLRNEDGRYSPVNAPNFKSNRRVTIRMRSVGSLPSGGGTVASRTSTSSGQPAGLVATGGDGVVELSWSESSDARITEYQIWYTEVGETVSTWNKILGSNADTSSHTVYRLKPGTEYEFRIRSVSASGFSAPSIVRVSTISGGWNTIWGGRIEDIRYLDRKSRFDTVFVELLGNMSYLSQSEIQTGVLSRESAAEAVWLIMRAAFVPEGVVGNISSNNTLQWWWASDDNALQMASSLEVAEDGSVYEVRTGQIVYDGANTRNQRVLEGIIYQFSDDLTDGTIHLSDTEVIQESKSIRNSVTVPVRQYSASVAEAVLWKYSASIRIDPGDVFTLIASHDLDGVGIWTDPVANTDYEASSSSGGGGVDLSGDVQVEASIFADTVNLQFTNSGGQTVYIINPQLRGRSISASSVTAIPAQDIKSIRESGRRNITLSNSWVDDINVARTLANSFLAAFLNPIDRLVVSFWAGLYPEVAGTIDIDDVVSIKRRGGVSTYRILHVIHEFGSEAHLTTLEAVPLPEQEIGTGVIILDVGPPLGKGVLGR